MEPTSNGAKPVEVIKRRDCSANVIWASPRPESSQNQAYRVDGLSITKKLLTEAVTSGTNGAPFSLSHMLWLLSCRQPRVRLS